MPTDICQNGPWLDKPDSEIRRAFEAHMRESAYPEDFEGVARKVKPPTEQDFRIIKKKVSVDPAKRNDTLAPCNLCLIDEKFKNDGMLIRDERGWLYLIGPICGADHYQDRYHDEERRFDLEEERKRATDFLLESANKIAGWREDACALIQHAIAAETAHGTLLKSNKAMTEFRRAINKNNGRLQIEKSRKILQVNGTEKTERYFETVGQIWGAAAVAPTCKAKNRLLNAIQALGSFGPNEDDVLICVAEAEAKGQLPEMAAMLRGAIAAISEVRRDLEEHQAFYSEANFKAIGTWAAQWNCPLKFKVDWNSTSRTLEVDGARKRSVIEISDLLRPLPAPLLVG